MNQVTKHKKLLGTFLQIIMIFPYLGSSIIMNGFLMGMVFMCVFLDIKCCFGNTLPRCTNYVQRVKSLALEALIMCIAEVPTWPQNESPCNVCSTMSR